MALIIPTIKNLESLRQQINALFVNVFATASAWSAVQTFPAAGIVIGTVKVLAGAGSPEGVVTAPKGSLYLRTDGGAATSQYTKESGVGSAGWVAK